MHAGAVPVEQVLDAGDVDAGGLGQRAALIPQRPVSVGAEQGHLVGTGVRHPGVEAADRLVYRVGGHHAVGGVLAARHHDQARNRVAHDVLA